MHLEETRVISKAVFGKTSLENTLYRFIHGGLEEFSFFRNRELYGSGECKICMEFDRMLGKISFIFGAKGRKVDIRIC